MMKYLLIFLALVLIKAHLPARTPVKLATDQIISSYQVPWLKGFNEINDNNMTLASSGASKIASDSQGNIILAGVFDGKFSIGMDTLVNTVPMLVGNAYLIKLTTDGNLIWAKNLNNLVSGFSRVKALYVDNSSNIYVAGQSPPTEINSSWIEPSKTFIIKVLPDGNVSWSLSMPSQHLVVGDMDSYNGDLLFMGAYLGKAAIGNDSLPKLQNNYDVGNYFIAKVNPQGQASLVNVGNEIDPSYYTMTMAVDRQTGDIYFTGSKAGLSGQPGTWLLLYLAKLSNNGQMLWSNIFDQYYGGGD